MFCFFFKQKTAYEMRISDWSSDVCSSDLRISRRVQRQFDVLRRATRWPVWADLATRLGVAFLLIGVVVLVHWSDRAGLQDSYDGHVGFLDVVYFTMISVTTTGFGDITPVSDRSRLIEAEIGRAHV